MATTEDGRRQRGKITVMPSGTLQVHVYAGLDPVTKKRHYLNETVPAGPKARAQAEKVRTRLLADVDADRQPRTSATVAQLLERYLEVIDVEAATARATRTSSALAERYEVSIGTVHRATTLLANDGVITVSRGRRAVVG